MFALQKGKLYKKEGKRFVPVNVEVGKISTVGKPITLRGEFKTLTPREVRCKFNIMEDNKYTFPLEKGDVKDEKKAVVRGEKGQTAK